MIGHQEPACMHGTQIGAPCAVCGGWVGGSGPSRIETGQVWRARGAPFGKVGIVEVAHGRVVYFQEEGIQHMDAGNFRDEFWFWGTPEPNAARAAFDARFKDFGERLSTAKAGFETDAIRAELEREVQAFGAETGVRPEIRFVLGSDHPILAIVWPDETALKRVLGKGPQ